MNHTRVRLRELSIWEVKVWEAELWKYYVRLRGQFKRNIWGYRKHLYAQWERYLLRKAVPPRDTWFDKPILWAHWKQNKTKQNTWPWLRLWKKRSPLFLGPEILKGLHVHVYWHRQKIDATKRKGESLSLACFQSAFCLPCPPCVSPACCLFHPHADHLFLFLRSSILLYYFSAQLYNFSLPLSRMWIILHFPLLL